VVGEVTVGWRSRDRLDRGDGAAWSSATAPATLPVRTPQACRWSGAARGPGPAADFAALL